MRVVVTGGRDFDDRAMLWAGLDRLYELSPITELIEGARWVNQAAGQEVVKHITVEAEWTKHGKSAGYLRNVRMADMRPDLVFAAPGGRGTTMMISIAHDRGIRVIYLEKMGVPRSTEPLD
jgi:hypothetical protein